jgi:hypothetical protein
LGKGDNLFLPVSAAHLAVANSAWVLACGVKNIPKGLNPSAQGWLVAPKPGEGGSETTLGIWIKKSINPNAGCIHFAGRRRNPFRVEIFGGRFPQGSPERFWGNPGLNDGIPLGFYRTPLLAPCFSKTVIKRMIFCHPNTLFRNV